MKRTHVSLRPEDIERIDEWAQKRNIKRSEALRRILDEYFEPPTGGKDGANRRPEA